MTVYYVDSNVAGPGSGTLGDPWDDIVSNINSLSAGDEMHLRGGGTVGARRSYTESGTIAPTVSGTAGSPIILRSYPGEFVQILSPGANTTLLGLTSRTGWTIRGEVSGSDYTFKIDGQDNGATRIIDIDSCANVTLENLEITQGNGDQLIRLRATSDPIIDGCKIYDGAGTGEVNGIQIVGGCSDFIVRNCDLYDFTADCIQVGGDSPGSATELDGQIYNNHMHIGVVFAKTDGENGLDMKTASNIVVHDNIFNGFRDMATANGEAVLFQNDSDGLEFYNNEIYDCNGGIISYKANTIIHHNLFHEMVYSSAANSMVHLRNSNTYLVYNNTFVDAFTGGTGYVMKWVGGPTVTFRNNIFSDTPGFNVGGGETLSYSYNCWTGTQHYAGTGDITPATAGFTAPGSNDYTLLASSDCVDAGTILTPYTDGFYGDAPDIGYNEYVGAGGGGGGGGGGGNYMDVQMVAADTGGGTQTINLTTGFGTPTGALFFISSCVTKGTAADHFLFGMGAASGTTERWALGFTSEHGVTTSDESSVSLTDSVLVIPDIGAYTPYKAQADLSSFGTDQVVLSWTVTPDAAYQIMVVAFTGGDFHAGNSAINNTVDASTDITAPGFEPDWVFGAIVDTLTGADTITHNRWCMGMAYNGVSLAQACAMWRTSNGAATPNNDGQLDSDKIGGLNGSTGAIFMSLEAGSFDASGFSITTRLAAPSATSDFFYFCGTGAQSYALITPTTPTTTGVASVTSVGFKPTHLLGIGTYFTALDTARNDSSEPASMGVFAATATTEACISGQKEEAQATTDNQAMADSQMLNFPQDDGADAQVCTLDSFTSSGWDWNFTNVVASATYMIVLAMQLPSHSGALVNSPRLKSKVGGGLV